MDSDGLKVIEQLENGVSSSKKIELRSVFKEGKITINPVPDGLGGYKGVRRLSEDQKKSLTYWATPTSKFILKHGVSFNLNVEEQKAIWEWVKHSPAIAQSEEACQFTPGAEFYVYEENKEVSAGISRKELKIKAGSLVISDAIANYPLRALALGVDMDDHNSATIKDFLLETAESDPLLVIAAYEAKDLNRKILLYKAVRQGVIEIDSNSMYRYGQTIMGVSEKSALVWLGNPENSHLTEVLEKEVNPQYFKKVSDNEPTGSAKAQTPTDNGGNDTNDGAPKMVHGLTAEAYAMLTPYEKGQLTKAENAAKKSDKKD